MAGPAFNSNQLLKNIRLDQLDIKKGELSGNLISGGLISAFASTGIRDEATKQTLTIQDDKIVVDKITVKEVTGDLLISGKLNVLGELTVTKIIANEIFSDQKYDKQYLEFIPTAESQSTIGAGLVWKDFGPTRMFVLRPDPERFYSSENLDIREGKSYSIGNVNVLSINLLGPTVKKSSLTEVGTLKTLTVSGEAVLGEFATFNSDLQRIGINTDQPVGVLTLTDFEQDVLLNLEVENGRAKVGTFNNRPFDLTAGDQTLITLEPKGIVNIGHEYRSDIITRAWGKIGVNVKNPEEDLEVRGNIRFREKLFAVDNSPPNKGNYKRGDIVWNENPDAGTFVGWVCVVAGTPGIWKTFGAISE